jgi:two-component system, sensor histidine kinase PdtaS
MANPLSQFITRSSIAFAILSLVYFTCTAQYYPAPPPVDPQQEVALLQRLKAAKQDADGIRIQLQLCNLYFNKPFKKKADLERALNYARKASARSTSLHDSSGYIDAQLFIADVLLGLKETQAAENILPLLNDSAKINLLLAMSFAFWDRMDDTSTADHEKAIQLAQQARDLSIRLHQPEKEILALLDIATVHIDLFNKSAEQELLDVIAKYRSIGYRDLHYAYSRLALCEKSQGNNDKATYWSLEALKTMRSTGDSLAAGDLYLVHALICGGVDEYQQCIDYSRLAIQSYAVHAGAWPLSDAVVNLAYGFRKMKRFSEGADTLRRLVKEYPPDNVTADIDYNSAIGELYTDSKNFAKAEPCLLRALALKSQHGLDAAGMNRDVGRLYIETHQYEKARPYLNKALSYPSSLSFRSYTHYLLYLVDSSAGNYKAAIEHLHRNHTLVDSSLAESKQRAVQKLLIEFETKEKENKLRIKDQDIALLNQKGALQKAELGRSNLLRNITFGGIFLLSIILFLLFKSYRNKQRTNRMITQKNATLQQLVADKEWLLKEVHHRVKNNLHTVICLLQSQALYLEDDALKALEISRNRIYAMSLIHQKIYQAEDIRTVDMTNYLPEFIRYLREGFGNPDHVHFQLTIDPIKLDVSQAIPIALIVNEAVTNAIKYAFPNRRPGTITILLQELEGHMKLTVKDNGVGMEAVLLDIELNSLGIQLMKGLAREINGAISFNIDRGTRISLIFSADPLFESHTGVTSSALTDAATYSSRPA